MTISTTPDAKPTIAKLAQRDILAEADAQAARPAPKASGMLNRN